jgi:arsenate reductase-like glutaredoxin family protein
MFNFRSPSFKKLGVKKGKLSRSDIIELMLKKPRLVRRSIARMDNKVYFGADKSVIERMIV